MTTNIHEKRLSKLQTLLSESGCDGFIIEDKINLYYMTGLDLSAGRLIVNPSGANLLVDSRYYEICKNSSPFPVVLSEANQRMTDFLLGLNSLGFSKDNTTYAHFIKLQSELEAINAANKGEILLKAIDNPIGKLRLLKDPDELETLREAARLGSEGYDYLISLLKEGISEAELAVELEIFWKRRGSKAIAFDPIIAFGANGSMPHYRVGNDKLKEGQSVLIDIGVNYRHYHSDMTRVVYFGKPDPKLHAIHQIVQQAQQAALDLCKPGTLIGELDRTARGIIDDAGYGENFTHSLGHGIGLEIHESPIIRNKTPYDQMVLEEGMVITIEPGIYLPGLGGVRIEDTVAITPDGHENLTNRPKGP